MKPANYIAILIIACPLIGFLFGLGYGLSFALLKWVGVV